MTFAPFLLAVCAGPPEPRRNRMARLAGCQGGTPDGSSALNPSWPMFSRSREKTRSAVREGVRVALADCEAIFRVREDNKRMKDQAARVCRALCRTRVVAEMHQRRGTRLADHLKLVLSIMDAGGYDGRRPQITSKFRPPASATSQM